MTPEQKSALIDLITDAEFVRDIFLDISHSESIEIVREMIKEGDS